MKNKYEILPLKMHVSMVQKGHMTLMEEKKSGLKVSTFAKRASELGEMKYALACRLEDMDRTKVDFFPVDSLVEYIHPMYSQKQKFGKVLEHVEGGFCLCNFEGDEFEVKVDPIHLRLRFVRASYPF